MSHQDRNDPYAMPRTMAATLDVGQVSFVQKVYGLLSLSILFAAFGSVLGLSLPPATGLIGVFGGLVLILVLSFTGIRHVFPLNLALLFGFTFLEGLSIGPLLQHYVAIGSGAAIPKALFIATATFAALTAYVFWTKQDFSYLGGALFAGLIGMLVVGLIAMFTGMGSTMDLAYSLFGVLLFMGFVLYDTSNLLHRYPSNEYVLATAALFLDVFNLFLYMLRILGGRNRD